MEIKKLSTDVLIIGGGTAGCYAAKTIGKNSNLNVLIAEKANIKRSGCLAAGVNALNAYITKNKTVDDYIDYTNWDAKGIVREDLVLTMAERFNKITKDLENLGLVILKDEEGNYIPRGNRNIKINGENIKVILANEVKKYPRIKVINHINITDLIVENNEVIGAFGIGVNHQVLYVINAKAVICTTGGAAGLYKPNNPGFSKHKMWYSPFNTGAGYAMGIRAGAEMTTFEMRFIALRCKDTIAPTGTIAQGVEAKQINSLGEIYENKYGLKTYERLHGTVVENREGRGPCYLKTKGISKEKEGELKKAYLNMAPSQTLRWVETNNNPSEENVEIEGTEPYVIGGHTGSGYWVDTERKTTIKALFAAGDVSGGAPQKYVTGALAEGEIAGESLLKHLNEFSLKEIDNKLVLKKISEIEGYLSKGESLYEIQELEEAMQKIMDNYAGGISTDYRFNSISLSIADKKIDELINLSNKLKANSPQELVFIYELKDRLTVCKVLIAHLNERKETRWNSFAENLDYPFKDDKYIKYINSKYENNKINMISRDIVKRGDRYEHINFQR